MVSSLYNSPVLFDKSKNVVEAFSVNLKKRKHLLFSDERGLPQIQNLVESLNPIGAPYSMYYLGNRDERNAEINVLQSLPVGITVVLYDCDELGRLFREQKMGTQLYIAGQWQTAESAFSLAVSAGFDEEEIQVYIDGPRRRFVFCPKCYSSTEISLEKEARCSHCGTMMEVSKFYSRVRKGYLGYPFTIS